MALREVAARTFNLGLKPLLYRLGYHSTRQAPAPLGSSPSFQDRMELTALVSIHRHFLKDSGWLETRNRNASFLCGRWVPWITYAAAHFIQGLPLSKMKVTEFGSGASTLFFARSCRSVVSYEFDAVYFEDQLSSISATNLLLRCVPKEFTNRSGVKACIPKSLRKFLVLDEAYGADGTSEMVDVAGFLTDAAANIADSDVILIDGGPRNLVAGLAAQSANANALIVVDNSDWAIVRPGCQSLVDAGFHEVPFRGLGPLNPYEWCTSVFVKDIGTLAFDAERARRAIID